MNVVLLSAVPPPIGGIATWTLRMLNIDKAYGCNYILVDEKMIGDRDMFGNNKKNIFIEIKRCFNIWKNLINKLKNCDVDIVQSCIPSSTLSMLREYICACITKKYKKKYIIHFHCTVPNTQDSLLWKILLKMICYKSDCIFVLNNQSLNYLNQVTKKRVEILPNFVEENEIVDKHIINTNIANIVYVGGVTESKGVLDILKIAKRMPNISFRLIGNPEEGVAIKAKEIKNVVLTGIKDKKGVKKELKNADLFLFLSKFKGEGFSIALLEAMASGLPCIVTNWAANKDMISNEGGYTIDNIDNIDIDNIIEIIKKIDNFEERKKYSERNIKVVKEKYISKVLFDRYVEIYNSLLL